MASSYWAGYHGSALVLTEAEFDDFLKRYAAVNCIEDMNEELDETPIREYEWRAGAFEEERNFEIVDVLSDENDGMTFWPFMRKNARGEYEQNVWSEKQEQIYKLMRSENCYVVFSDKSLDSVRSFFEMRYTSYDEFKQEFKNKMEVYLPEDFDWDAHLGSFSYAAYA